MQSLWTREPTGCCVYVCVCMCWVPHLKLTNSCSVGELKTLVCTVLVASCHSNQSRKPLVFTLCMLLRFDNIAVRYITPAHGVYHSERHFMLYNHSIYISFCIKILNYSVKSAPAIFSQNASKDKKKKQKKEEKEIWMSTWWWQVSV